MMSDGIPICSLAFRKYGFASGVNQLDAKNQKGVNTNANPLPGLIYDERVTNDHIQASIKYAFAANIIITNQFILIFVT